MNTNIGGMENRFATTFAASTLQFNVRQGVDFPSGLVGVMQGIFLFSVLGGEILVRYQVRFSRPSRAPRTKPAA